MTIFVGVELVLALAIPFLAIAGYHELLDSRAGRFVEEPGEADPGWRAVVEPSPLTAVVETERGRITGIALLAGNPDSGIGGTVVLVPGTLAIDGRGLDRRTPDDAVTALGRALRLGIHGLEVVDENRWANVLGDRAYVVDNPDPVVDDDGEPLLVVGPTEVDADNAAVFLGRPVAGADEISLLLRRRLLWTALIADPPTSGGWSGGGGAGGADPLLDHLDSVRGASARVVELPLRQATPVPELDPVTAEGLIREVVPVPSGAEVGDRVRVRVLGRSPDTDLPAVAAVVAGTGMEVVEIGNAASFDGGPTEILLPSGLDEAMVAGLVSLIGTDPIPIDGTEADSVVTLLVGPGFVVGTR
jgi:hypothetical protein